MATTHSPIMRSLLRPTGIVGRFWRSTFTTAMSVSGSSPSTLAGRSVPSRRVTTTLVALATTCWLVTMTPFGRMMKPVPYPCTMRAPSGTKKKSHGERGGASRVDVTLTDTTAPEARSTAATRAVRRLVPVCASAAVRAATCAAAALTDTLSVRVVEPRSRHAAETSSRRSAALRIGHQRAARRGGGFGSLEVQLRGIAGPYEVEALRRRRRTGALIVARFEQHLDVAEGTPPEADVHHRAHQHPHHVVQEAVGLDMKADPAARASLAPLRSHDPAAIVPLGLTGHGERAEIMCAVQQHGPRTKDAEIQRPCERPFEGPPKRRGGGLVSADVVPVPATEGALSGVEAGLHQLDFGDPAVRWQQSVERAAQVVGGPLSRGGEAHAEAFRVDARVGTSGCVGGNRAGEEALQDALELGLNRAAGRLALPSDKPGAVEVQRGEEGPAHRPAI